MADNTITFGCNLSVDNFWDLPDFARRAEDLGFDRVAIGEHVMDGNPPRPTVMGLPAMAAAAGATTRLRVLTGIVIAPLYHPVMLAKLVVHGGPDFGRAAGFRHRHQRSAGHAGRSSTRWRFRSTRGAGAPTRCCGQ